MSVNVSMSGKPMMAATNPDTRSWLMRSCGLSAEDADAVIERVTADVLSDPRIVMAVPDDSAPEPAPPPEPLRVMQTTEGIGDGMVVRTWVNVERITQEVVSNVTTLVADQMITALASLPVVVKDDQG